MIKETIKCEFCGEVDIVVEYEKYFPSHYVICDECKKKPQPRHTCQDEAGEWLKSKGLLRIEMVIISFSKETGEYYQSTLHLDGAKYKENEHSWKWDDETSSLSPSVRAGDNMYHYFLRNEAIQNCGDAKVNDLVVVSIHENHLTKSSDGNGWNVARRIAIKGGK